MQEVSADLVSTIGAGAAYVHTFACACVRQCAAALERCARVRECVCVCVCVSLCIRCAEVRSEDASSKRTYTHTMIMI